MKFYKQKIRVAIVAVCVLLLGSGILLLFFTHQVAYFNTKTIGGDPGNKRLSELSNDTIFSVLPPDAQLTSVTHTPAKYRSPAFESPGWDEPSITINFVNPQPPTSIYQFYDTQALSYGWHPGNKGSLGLTDTWNKKFPDGANATLSLSIKGGGYQLNGSVNTY